jgi:S-disulfanyl-L-cysteine oxidoreductase SoxD
MAPRPRRRKGNEEKETRKGNNVPARYGRSIASAAFGLWLGIAAGVVFRLDVHAHAPRPEQASGEKTVGTGVFTEEQAKAGKAAYATACASCHLENLAGDTMSPALVGADFIASWENKKLRPLYSRILSTMPADNPGTLTEKTVLDIVAYLLEANGFPPGSAPLERADDLNTIAFVRPK